MIIIIIIIVSVSVVITVTASLLPSPQTLMAQFQCFYSLLNAQQELFPATGSPLSSSATCFRLQLLLLIWLHNCQRFLSTSLSGSVSVSISDSNSLSLIQLNLRSCHLRRLWSLFPNRLKAAFVVSLDTTECLNIASRPILSQTRPDLGRLLEKQNNKPLNCKSGNRSCLRSGLVEVAD